MSIPTTETKPDGLHSLPPSQRRSLRKVIESASSRDINDILREIARHAVPLGQYYWELLICLLLLIAGSLLRSNLILLAGILAIPMAKPLLSLVYGGALPSTRHFWNALVGIVVTIAGFYFAGWIVRSTAPVHADHFLTGAALTSLSESSIVWIVLILTAALTSYWFTFHETLSRIASILLGYLVLMPFFAAGQASSLPLANGSLPLLLTGFTRLGMALLAIFLTTWFLGFPPRKALGIIISVIILSSGTVSIFEMVRSQIAAFKASTPEPTFVVFHTATAAPSTATPPPTATYTKEPSPTAQPSLSPSPSPSPEPTATVQVYSRARVTSENGLVVREAPSTAAYILTYVNKGDVVQLTGKQEKNQGILWEQIIAPNGVTGWVSGYYIILVNP